MPTWRELKNNPQLWDVFYLRQQIISAIREFFDRKNILEVFTPILQPAVIPESYHEVFSTTLIDRKLKKNTRYLIPSPEVSIKKLLAAGLTNCFEITRCFRNRESGSNFHRPEFTSLESYRTAATYFDIMKDCEELILFINEKIN